MSIKPGISDLRFQISNQGPTRRQMLRGMAGGFGMLGLAGMLGQQALAGSFGAASASAVTRHLAPRAKRVIFLFMNGGPSHVDTFDPKPALKDHEGEVPASNTMRKKKGGYVPSPFAFAPQGQ